MTLQSVRIIPFIHHSVLALSLWPRTPLLPQRASSAGFDSTISLTVIVRQDTVLVERETVRSGPMQRPTDTDGRAVLQLDPGDHQIIAAKIGFKPDTLLVRCAAASRRR